MAFADPQSITISGTAVSLPRTSFDGQKGEFSAADGTAKLIVSHTNGRRHRRLLRVDHAKIAADPLLAGTNAKYSMSVQLVVDVPPVGYSIAEQKAVVDAVMAFLTASSGAKIGQYLGGEA
jgi:hypothetical protein